MEELAQPQPEPQAPQREAPEIELARLREQLQHYQDAAIEQQRQYAGMHATAWGGVHPLWFYQQAQQQGNLEDLGPLIGQWATDAFPRLTPQDAESFAREQAERRTREEEALTRALALLEEKLGPEAVAKIQAGGGFKIASRIWPTVVYLVPRDPHQMVKVLADGHLATEVCIVSTDNSLPWPDIMLHRITAIEADESILFATGVVHPEARTYRLFAKLRKFFRNHD